MHVGFSERPAGCRRLKGHKDMNILVAKLNPMMAPTLSDYR